MQEFEVIIIGAGPAGGHCGRLLSQLGYNVLLVEQLETFQQNNFSSAGSPLKTIEQFNLPSSTVATYWRKLDIIASNVTRHWQSENPLGVVFDFAQLRQFLAEDMQRKGGTLWLGHRYINYEQEHNQISVTLQQRKGNKITLKTRLLVDATGYTRAVIYANKKNKPPFYKGVGIEYIIQIEPTIYQQYAESLSFFLGYKWSPQGYSWIFPMDNYRLKVGSAFLEGNHKVIKELKPLKYYIHQIIGNYLKLDNYKLIDSHGSILDYSSGLNDIYYKDNIIAIGDAVSMVNFLGGEGIRHGMEGAEIGAKYIHQHLSGQIHDFSAYQQELKNRYSRRWNQCEGINRKVYLEYSDQQIDRGVKYLKYLNIQDIMAVLFEYKLEKASQGLKRYLWVKLNKLWSNVKLFLLK